MKIRPLLAIIAILSGALVKGQTAYDAFRYSQETLQGSARYMALAGSFGALGGDFSAIVNNPAGAAVFLTSEIGLSANFTNQEVGASLGNGIKKLDQTRFDIDQFGMVFPLNDNREDSDWPRIAFAFNYQKNNDYDQSFNAVGTSNVGLDRYFLYYANGLALSNVSLLDGESIPELYQYLGDELGYGAQQAFLGYQGYVIDPVSNAANETQYLSNALYNTVSHDYFLRSNGAHKKYSFTLSGQYKNRLYLGLSINTHNIKYSQTGDLEEYGYTANSPIEALRFNNELHTLGNGVSVQLGAILRVGSGLRWGISYHSPTWLTLYDETVQFLVADYYDEVGFNSVTVEPNVVNSYPEYELRLPSKTTFSGAYTFGNRGLISVDYTRRNYGNASFQEMGESAYFSSVNQQIQDRYATATRWSVGGEYRMGKLSLRAGYFTESDRIKSVLSGISGYTLGLGYQNGGNVWGLALVDQTENSIQPLYNNGLTNNIKLESQPFQIILSYNFKL
jgi:long-subunit fatty acid transport protein